MTRSPLSTALVGVLAAALAPLLLVPPAPGHAAPRAGTADPLAVSIHSMSPSVVPRRGPLTLRGEVTNTSEETWTDLQAYLVTSSSPLTTRAELEEAVSSDPAAEVATRLTAGGLFDELGDLEPGESTGYTLTVPRSSLGLSGAPGVYWTGVQVLGASPAGRDGFADGRARTFVPLMPERSRRIEVALVAQLRDQVRRLSSGRLLGLERWQASLASDGRLGRLAELVAESEGPLTWVLDPAVLDAISSVAADNPALSTGDDGTGPESPDEEPDPGEGPTEDPGEDPSPSASEPAPEDPEATDEETMVEASPEAEEAARWLDDFVSVAAGTSVMALPYGDLDVAGVGTNRLGRILRKARTLSLRSTEAHGLDASPVVAPPGGLLPGRSLAATPPEVPVLLADQAFPEARHPVLTRPDGTRVVLADGAVGAGGPGPDDPLSVLALRQRVLATAAVHSLEGVDTPLVVTLPADFDPGGAWRAADLFGGLDVPWLRQVDLAGVLASTPSHPSDEPPFYGPRARARHVPFANQLATAELVEVGRVFAHLLTSNDTVADELAKAAMLASSYAARARPEPALQRARATTLRVRRVFSLVDVDGPGFVMMSSETGPISVTVANNLDVPVTVRVEARTPRDDLRFNAPEPVELAPGERRPVRLRAQSGSIGVHEVTLLATTAQGEPLGAEVQFNVRTSNVGLVVWLVMGAGGTVLLVMIGYRIARRVRERRTGTDELGEEAE